MIRVFRTLALALFVWWSSSSCKMLRLDLLDTKFCRALSHRLQYLFEWRRFALNPTQRVDARYHEGGQVRADEATFFQLLYCGRRALPTRGCASRISSRSKLSYIRARS
jgi:hypothetical protein